MNSSHITIRLGAIATARSGDKGSSANVGVIARTPAAFAFLRTHLTPERVMEYFAPLGPTGIKYHVFPRSNA